MPLLTRLIFGQGPAGAASPGPGGLAATGPRRAVEVRVDKPRAEALASSSQAIPGTPLPGVASFFVLGADPRHRGIIGLLGRDFLANGLLVYPGASGLWKLAC